MGQHILWEGDEKIGTTLVFVCQVCLGEAKLSLKIGRGKLIPWESVHKKKKKLLECCHSEIGRKHSGTEVQMLACK